MTLQSIKTELVTWQVLQQGCPYEALCWIKDLQTSDATWSHKRALTITVNLRTVFQLLVIL